MATRWKPWAQQLGWLVFPVVDSWMWWRLVCVFETVFSSEVCSNMGLLNFCVLNHKKATKAEGRRWLARSTWSPQHGPMQPWHAINKVEKRGVMFVVKGNKESANWGGLFSVTKINGGAARGVEENRNQQKSQLNSLAFNLTTRFCKKKKGIESIENHRLPQLIQIWGQ